MYTHRPHMSAVEYTCVFHRLTTTKPTKSQSYYKFVSCLSYCKINSFSKQNQVRSTISQVKYSLNTLIELLTFKFWSLETNHKFWVDLEIVARNFHKISPRPPWSVFIITQHVKIIFKSNQSHWKSNTII